jgi:tetratricopeptide (TPR) repeat protein
MVIVFKRDPATEAQGRLRPPEGYHSPVQPDSKRGTPQSSESIAAQGGKTSEAAAPAQKISIDPVAEIYNKHGADLYRHGRYDEAILQFNEAIKTSPNYAIAYNNRGLAFAVKGDLESAASDFAQALRINPYYYDAQFNHSLVTKK